MWFWLKIVSLFLRLRTMADESILQQSIPSPSQTLEDLNGPEPLDPDLRPGIGRCYPEAREVERLAKELRSIYVALGAAVAKLGDCRANAQAANAVIEADMTAALVTQLGSVIDQFDEDLQALTDCPACKQPAEVKAD
jgi:hypothetical protein